MLNNPVTSDSINDTASSSVVAAVGRIATAAAVPARRIRLIIRRSIRGVCCGCHSSLVHRGDEPLPVRERRRECRRIVGRRPQLLNQRPSRQRPAGSILTPLLHRRSGRGLGPYPFRASSPPPLRINFLLHLDGFGHAGQPLAALHHARRELLERE